MTTPEYFIVKNSSGDITAYIYQSADSIKNCNLSCRLNGESTFEFYIPATSEKLSEITPDCTLVAGNREFTLLKEDAIDTVMDESGRLWAKVMAYESWYLLDKDYPEPYINNDPGISTPADLAVIIVSGGSDLSGGLYTPGSAEHALYAILDGTDWSVGTVDVTGTHDLETEKKSVLTNIKEIQKIWGGYLVYDSENKTVGLRSRTSWQNYTGFQIRYSKNLKHITRTQNNDIITKLYVFGKDDLDIASVNGGIKYLTDNSYTPLTLTGQYKNESIEDATELMEAGEDVISQVCDPRYTYQVKIADLRTLPEYSHEDFSLGDMVDVIHDDLSINEQIRIILHKYDLFQPWKCEIELDEPETRLKDLISTSFATTDYVSESLNSKGQFSGNKLVSLSVGKLTAGTLSAEIAFTSKLILTSGSDQKAGLTAEGSGDSNVRIWAGAAYADRATAPFRVTQDGLLYATGATISGDITITGGSGINMLSDAGDLATADDLDDISDGSTYKKTTQNEKTGAGRAYTAIDSNAKIVTDVLSRVLPADDIGSPNVAGLYAGHDYFGFHNGNGLANGWNVYIKNDGDFLFKGDEDHFLAWDGSTFAVKGDITNTGGVLNADYVTSGTLTAVTVRTAASGSRIELTNGNVFKGYNSSDQLHGLYVYPVSYVDLILYRNGSEFFTVYDSIGAAVILQYYGADKLAINSSGGTLYGTWTCSDLTNGASDYATESWVSSNFSASGHDHDSRYYTETESDLLYAAASHTHDSRYYTESECDSLFAAASHTHDSRYYTESESDSLFAAIGHNHDSDYADISHNHDSDYADISHNHDGDYTEDYAAQGIKFQYFSDHLEVSLNGSTWKTITYDA